MDMRLVGNIVTIHIQVLLVLLLAYIGQARKNS